MDIVSSSNKLWIWFSTNDSFQLKDNEKEKDDFDKLILLSENPNGERASIICALSEFEKANLVQSLKYRTSTIWTLRRPFSSIEQTISISSNTIKAIADVINHFCQTINNNTDLCNATQITEKDIKSLLYIIMHLTSKLNKVDE